MSKHKTKEEWIKLFKKYESGNWDWHEYYHKHVVFALWPSKGRGRYKRYNSKLESARSRFRIKYKKWKLLDNLFMEHKKQKRGPKKIQDIEEILNNLTEKEKNDIVRRYFEITKKKDKKKEANSFSWSKSRKAYIFNLHRTTFYKKSKQRKYRFDKFKREIINTFNENKARYGSKRLEQALLKKASSLAIEHWEITWCDEISNVLHA